MDNSCALIGILRKLMIDEDSVARDNSKQSAQMSNLYTEAMRNLAKWGDGEPLIPPSSVRMIASNNPMAWPVASTIPTPISASNPFPIGTPAVNPMASPMATQMTTPTGTPFAWPIARPIAPRTTLSPNERYAIGGMRKITKKRPPSKNHPKLTEKYCAFCKNNGEKESVYKSHDLKDDRKRILCPRLQQYVCSICGASGYDAHTLTHCPKRKLVGE